MSTFAQSMKEAEELVSAASLDDLKKIKQEVRQATFSNNHHKFRDNHELTLAVGYVVEKALAQRAKPLFPLKGDAL